MLRSKAAVLRLIERSIESIRFAISGGVAGVVQIANLSNRSTC